MKLFDWLGRVVSKSEIKSVTEESQTDMRSQQYIKELAVYTAVGLLSDLMASCEIMVLQDGKAIRDGIWYRLNVAANENQTSNELIARWVADAYYKGSGMIVPLSGSLYNADGYSVEEYPLLGNRYMSVSIGTLSLKRTFGASEVFLLRSPGGSVQRLVDGMFAGYGDMMSEAADAYKRASGEKYTMQTGARPSGTPEEQQRYMTAMRQNLQKFASAGTAAYPLNKDQALTKISGGSNGSYAGDMVSLRKDVYAIVASALHIPESLLSGNMTNVDQIMQQTLTMAIDPLAARIDQELTRKLYTQQQITDNGYRIHVDTSNLIHVDAVAMADKLDKLISSGICCIDEVRSKCSLPEIGTDWSRRHYITRNNANIESELDPLEGGEKHE